MFQTSLARPRSLRWDPARAQEGAVCVTAADLPGPNGVQLLDDGWPILAADWELIRPLLEENERLFGIPLRRLLSVDGEERSRRRFCFADT